MAARRAAGRPLLSARELFLEGRTPDDFDVRDEIRASWQRSLDLAIGADRVEPAQVERKHAQSLLLDSARPVLRDVAGEIANEPVALLLTDARGVVLERVCGDTALIRHLDKKQLAPGSNYAESSVGTNGIGTALETRVPTLVTGDEHFVGELCEFGCAGTPIIHPVTSALIGVLDLTSWAVDTNPLLLSFARSTAKRIQESLLERSNQREIALVREYLSACQHSGGSVLALNGELTMMNTHIQQAFDLSDQSALLARVADATGSSSSLTLLADLPSGQVARLDYRPAFTDANVLAGGVIRVQLGSPAPTTARPAPKVRLPGVVGTSPKWQRVCRAVLDSQQRAEWLVLEGEPGSGKLALLSGVHRAVHADHHFRILDAEDAEDPGDAEAWLDEVADEIDQPGGGILVLRRVHLLSDPAASGLANLLLECAGQTDSRSSPWIAMTMSAQPRNNTVDTELLPLFPHTIQTPALRHHIDDLPSLVEHLLGRIARNGRLSVSDAAMNLLTRMPWQGNVEQLRRVLTRAAQQRRAGTIDVDALPPECRAASRRRFTPLESLERDAIIDALDTHQGNKDLAATSLGMSRATIYRKIKGYGILTPPQ